MVRRALALVVGTSAVSRVMRSPTAVISRQPTRPSRLVSAKAMARPAGSGAARAHSRRRVSSPPTPFGKVRAEAVTVRAAGRPSTVDRRPRASRGHSRVRQAVASVPLTRPSWSASIVSRVWKVGISAMSST